MAFWNYVNLAKVYDVNDQDLTAGYAQTFLLMKSTTYSSTFVFAYSFMELIQDLTLSLAATYAFMWIVYQAVWPIRKVALMLPISKVYRVAQNETTNFSKLKQTLIKNHKQTLQQRLENGIQSKMKSIIDQKVSDMKSSEAFHDNLRKAAKINLDDYSQLETSAVKKHSLLLYLSTAMMRRPKFAKISTVKFCCALFKNSDTQLRQFNTAKAKVVKDLDIATHLKTVSKVKAMVSCLLDDKQRLMLKFTKHRSIDL